MIKTIRLEEEFSEESSIEDKLTLLMELSEQLIIKSIVAYETAETLKMKLEGDA